MRRLIGAFVHTLRRRSLVISCRESWSCGLLLQRLLILPHLLSWFLHTSSLIWKGSDIIYLSSGNKDMHLMYSRTFYFIGKVQSPTILRWKAMYETDLTRWTLRFGSSPVSFWMKLLRLFATTQSTKWKKARSSLNSMSNRKTYCQQRFNCFPLQ